MSEGYTYTTLSSRPGEPVRVRVSFYLDQDAWIAVCGTEASDPRPHLAISHGEVSVSMGPAHLGQMTEQDARLARMLADQATSYAAEIERLAAAGGPGSAAA